MAHRELVASLGSAGRAFDARVPPGERAARLAEAEALLASAARCGASVIVRGEADYPARLLDLPDPPPLLFALGNAATAAPPAVAIVGTRSSSAYGERVARELAGAVARAGGCVVSGMARGVDAAAHVAALEYGGRTVAVLGTGVDVAYPAAHRALHRRIAAHGLVLSEHPPGEHAHAGAFPRRNRIVAALADVAVVVEAGVGSGALITAAHALELGRTVAAVPGPIDSAGSAGTNELLRDGASVIATTADLLALAGLTAPARRPPSLAPDEQRVWEALAGGAMDADTLAARTGLPATRCLTAITTLELAGAIECELSGAIRRR